MADMEVGIFLEMSRVLNKINRESDKVLCKHDLTRGQFAVLEALYQKGDLSVGCVQEIVLTTSGNIPVIVKNLEKKGFVTKSRDSKDRRKFILSITDQGREKVEQVYPENEEIIVKSMDTWKLRDKKRLKDLMQNFLENRELDLIK